MRHAVESPGRFGQQLGRSFAKYLLAPLEGLAALAVRLVCGPGQGLADPWRYLLAGVMAPLWLLSFSPGPWLSPERRRWALIGLMWMVFFCASASIAPTQGERLRLPAVPLVLPALAFNLAAIAAWLQSKRAGVPASQPKRELS